MFKNMQENHLMNLRLTSHLGNGLSIAATYGPKYYSDSSLAPNTDYADEVWKNASLDTKKSNVKPIFLDTKD